MARGFESKGVADQQQDDFHTPAREAPGEPAEVTRQRRGFELGRADILARLRSAQSDPHREHLRRALAALDEQARALGSPPA